MTYSAPAADSVGLVLKENYSAPSSDNVILTLEAGSASYSVILSELLNNLGVANVLLNHHGELDIFQVFDIILSGDVDSSMFSSVDVDDSLGSLVGLLRRDDFEFVDYVTDIISHWQHFSLNLSDLILAQKTGSVVTLVSEVLNVIENSISSGVSGSVYDNVFIRDLFFAVSLTNVILERLVVLDYVSGRISGIYENDLNVDDFVKGMYDVLVSDILNMLSILEKNDVLGKGFDIVSVEENRILNISSKYRNDVFIGEKPAGSVDFSIYRNIFLDEDIDLSVVAVVRECISIVIGLIHDLWSVIHDIVSFIDSRFGGFSVSVVDDLSVSDVSRAWVVVIEIIVVLDSLVRDLVTLFSKVFDDSVVLSSLIVRRVHLRSIIKRFNF